MFNADLALVDAKHASNILGTAKSALITQMGIVIFAQVKLATAMKAVRNAII